MRVHQGDNARGIRFPRHQVETGAIDITVTTAIHSDLIPALGWQIAEIGMRYQ